MTITQERGQLSLVLSREIQAHERERRAKRREIFKRYAAYPVIQVLIYFSLQANDSTYYYYSETPLRDYGILLDESQLDQIVNNNNNNNNNSNSTTVNTANLINDNEDLESMTDEEINDNFTALNDNLNALSTMIMNDTIPLPSEPLDDNDDNENGGEGSSSNNNANPEEPESLSPQQFQDMLKAYVDLLTNNTIPDEDPRITGAICQWYTSIFFRISWY